ncbi:hypothetical protein RHSIM_Rhsim01G0046100 [Rhododendron simsii]|uniref:Uncharacterized protein n=1 Tax=Rhododendron simsii TaxID=118357 RepID=A0A834HMA6_RHOSS|nr:hypothetical protein RHSIM_Rhsim01G0046100 [Rhododendron simsii]
MCECVSVTLEQVAANRLVYISGGFGCAVVVIGFALGELLWMKKMKLHIGILDPLDFLAALSQVDLVFTTLNVIDRIRRGIAFVDEEDEAAHWHSQLAGVFGSTFTKVGEWIFYVSHPDEPTVHDSPTIGTFGLRRPPGSCGLQFYPLESSSGDEEFRCVCVALEQLAGDRLAYVLGGFWCAVVAIGLVMGELLWMKKMKLHIGILDLLGFLAALSQDGDHVRISIESLKYAAPEVREWIFYKSESDEGSSVDRISVVYDSSTNGTFGLHRPPSSRGPRLFYPLGFNKPEFYPFDSSSGDEYETFSFRYMESMDKKEI